jgi:hypothetical protein
VKTHKQSCEVSKRGRQDFPRTIITMLSPFVVHLPLSFFATLGFTKIPLIFIAVCWFRVKSKWIAMERSRRIMVSGFVKEIWIQMRIFRLMLIIITPKT